MLELVEAGDNVMVDQGFDIAGMVPDGVAVNMSPFLAGREQTTTAETEETISIASRCYPAKYSEPICYTNSNCMRIIDQLFAFLLPPAEP